MDGPSTRGVVDVAITRGVVDVAITRGVVDVANTLGVAGVANTLGVADFEDGSHDGLFNLRSILTSRCYCGIISQKFGQVLQ